MMSDFSLATIMDNSSRCSYSKSSSGFTSILLLEISHDLGVRYRNKPLALKQVLKDISFSFRRIEEQLAKGYFLSTTVDGGLIQVNLPVFTHLYVSKVGKGVAARNVIRCAKKQQFYDINSAYLDVFGSIAVTGMDTIFKTLTSHNCSVNVVTSQEFKA